MTGTNRQPSDNSDGVSNATEPRAMIHKRILDVAATHPEASVETLAETVGGATPDLVEKVLEKYGDPGESENEEAITDGEFTQGTLGSDTEGSETVTDGSTSKVTGFENDSAASVDSKTENDDDKHQEETQDSTEEFDTTAEIDSDPELTVPDLNSLTETQEETLRAIHEDPSATQAELADQFNVTSASISQRVNSIDGFEWTKRQTITEALFATSDEMSGQKNKVAASDGGTETISESTTRDIDSSSEAQEEINSNSDTESSATETSDTAVPSEEVERLEERLEQLEQRIADLPTATPKYGRVEPALVHKVVHACIESEQISENEELEIIQQLIGPEEN